MNLLKIGSLNIPRNRWKDALYVFKNVFCLEKEQEIPDKRFIYIKLKHKGGLRGYINSKLLGRITNHKDSKIIVNFFIMIIRIINMNVLNKIKNLDFDYVHSSYNDFDESGIFTLICYPYIKGNYITRAYKETRPEKNYIEKVNFKIANRIVLNSEENKKYFINKHSDINWNNKRIILGLDEDYRSKDVLKNILYASKLSEDDGKKHVVILAGRVMSDESDKRSGGRLCYIDVIKELLHNGFIVHLHCFRVYNDINNINQYNILANEYKNKFFIEKPLDFEKNSKESYYILSRYDYGILHNISNKNKFVSLFDEINIPHRFYEYENANVIPILKKGKTILMEKFIIENNCGIVYNNLNELKNYNTNKIKFFKRSFLEYINVLYKNI